MSKQRTIIIGAGQAGARTALALRSLKYQGEILLIGEEEYMPYQRPPLSKAVLTGNRSLDKTMIVSPDEYHEKNIILLTGTKVCSVSAKIKQVTCEDGQIFEYDYLVFATGSAPRSLDIPGSSLGGIQFFRDADDTKLLASRLKDGVKLVVVGGGFIGLEIAASARELGCQVTVLETMPRLLSRSLPEQAARKVLEIHQENGVNIITSINIKSFAGDLSVSAVELADGRSINADVVVIGIGVIPNTILAKESGVICENGIVTDEHNRASQPHVYAIGDCSNAFIPRYRSHIRLESYQSADLQAITTAHSIVDQPRENNPIPWLWSQQYNWTIQTAGVVSGGEKFIRHGEMNANKTIWFVVEGNIIKAVIGIGHGSEVARDVKVVIRLIEYKVDISDYDLGNEDLVIKDIKCS